MRCCPHHQTWDFDCTICVEIATDRIVRRSIAARNDLARTMSQAPGPSPKRVLHTAGSR